MIPLRKKLLSLLGAAGALALGGISPAQASSHSDAPLIKLDPQANLTDVYAFVRTRPNGQKVLVVEVSVRPFSEPGDGGAYEAFSDDALYSIHIANPTTGAEVQRYDFRFSAVGATGNYKNLNTILRYGRGADINGQPDAGSIQDIGDAHQNFVQSYQVTKTVNGTSSVLNGSSPLLVPPYNTGVRTTPYYNDPNTGKAVSGASTRAGLDRYTREATYDLSNGTTVFAGSREDGFYADTPGIFDFLDPRILSNKNGNGLGQDGTGVDGFKGFNVLHYAIVIPISDLPAFTFAAPFTNAQAPGVGNRSGLGVYASVSRPRVTLRRTDGENQNSGPFIQVNRLGNPLFNEVLVALKDKDRYNRTSPTLDGDPTVGYAKYAMNPEIAALENAVFGTNFATSGRFDIAAVYIPDVLRVDTSTGAVPVAGEAGYKRLSFLQGDAVTNGAGASIPGGWPNGRRFGDDVVDIALTAVASGPTYSTVTVVGDNVTSNDQVYNMTFPYAATPHAGSRNSKDSGINK